GHACLRTLQLVRAPSLLHDYHMLENAIGGHLLHDDDLAGRLVRPDDRGRLYRIGFLRGQLDEALDRFILRPFTGSFPPRARLERAWTDFLTGNGSRESDRLVAPTPAAEEL